MLVTKRVSGGKASLSFVQLASLLGLPLSNVRFSAIHDLHKALAYCGKEEGRLPESVVSTHWDYLCGLFEDLEV